MDQKHRKKGFSILKISLNTVFFVKTTKRDQTFMCDLLKKEQKRFRITMFEGVYKKYL